MQRSLGSWYDTYIKIEAAKMKNLQGNKPINFHMYNHCTLSGIVFSFFSHYMTYFPQIQSQYSWVGVNDSHDDAFESFNIFE